MKWMKALFMGKMVFDIISQFIPKALEDGKLTMDEIFELVKQTCQTFDFHIEFKVPAEIKDVVVGVVEKVDTTINK